MAYAEEWGGYGGSVEHDVSVLMGDLGALEARVTTNDLAPDGDLIIRDAPNGRQIGGAAKSSMVEVLEWDAGTVGGVKWSKVRANEKAMNWPAATGYAKQSFLRLAAAIVPPAAPVVPPAFVPGVIDPPAPGAPDAPAPAASSWKKPALIVGVVLGVVAIGYAATR